MTMISPSGATGATGGKSPTGEELRLRKTAMQLEGLFVNKLFAAMRDTVPEGGLIDKSNAEDTFTSMLDEKMSEQVPSQWSGVHSLAHALYNQLRSHLGSAGAASTGDLEAASTALHTSPISETAASLPVRSTDATRP